jgi:hypothetical protein
MGKRRRTNDSHDREGAPADLVRPLRFKNIRKALPTSWPPLSWLTRWSLQEDPSGTCRGVIHWPQTESEWTNFLEYVQWATMEVNEPETKWKEACLKSGIFDMSRWAEVKLIKSWPIDEERVKVALNKHPPSRGVREKICDAVSSYL